MSRPSSDDLPEGFHYLPDFLSVEEERGILDRINTLAFGTLRCMGESPSDGLSTSSGGMGTHHGT